MPLSSFPALLSKQCALALVLDLVVVTFKTLNDSNYLYKVLKYERLC